MRDFIETSVLALVAGGGGYLIISFLAKISNLFRGKKLKKKKGSIKNIAIVAGIIGAKETSRLIPLCHNIPIDSVNVDITKNTKIA